LRLIGIISILLLMAGSVCQAQWQPIDPPGDAVVRSEGGFIRIGCRRSADQPPDEGKLTMMIYEPRAEWTPGQEVTVRFNTDTGSHSSNTSATASTSHVAIVWEGHVLFEFASIKNAKKSFVLRGDNFERTYSAQNLMASVQPALRRCGFTSPWTDP